MRTIKLLMLIIFIIFNLSQSMQVWGKESGPGNGTDYVEVLFAQAKVEVAKLLDKLSKESLSKLQIDPLYTEWLTEDVNGSARYIKFKFYSKVVKYQFQDAPCTDEFGKESGICFYINPDNSLLVIISKLKNKLTTLDQAKIMILHEIGHFTGELDHLFLDEFGARFISAMNANRQFEILTSTVNGRDVYISAFEGKKQCDAGVSNLAMSLKEQVKTELYEKCLLSNLVCNLEQIVFSYSGVVNFVVGVGYDMSASCTVKGVLKGLK
ncbi:MAG: hypothetical protein ISR65_04185 [Bacteriovoracaceae bacterium]|nr:hypothetical protein [Bacteriovoracaceae bacterium]